VICELKRCESYESCAFPALNAGTERLHVPIGTSHDFRAEVQDSARRVELESAKTKELAAGPHSNGRIIRLSELKSVATFTK
jgi:hypothetical protein